MRLQKTPNPSGVRRFAQRGIFSRQITVSSQQMSYALISSFDPSALDDFRSLRGKGGHVEKGLFIAEAPKIVRKVLTSALAIESAFMTPEFFEEMKPLFEAREDTTDVYLAPKSEMEKIVGYNLHQGVMLAVRIPANRILDAASLTWKHPFQVLALDSIADAENMGAMIRNAAAFGVDAVLVDDQSCSPFLRRSVRVSMGTITDVEIIRVPDLASALHSLKSLHPCLVVGAALGTETKDLRTITVPSNCVIVFGSEGWGLRPEVSNKCDLLASIAMADEIDSLNVAIASGIFLYALQHATNG